MMERRSDNKPMAPAFKWALLVFVASANMLALIALVEIIATGDVTQGITLALAVGMITIVALAPVRVIVLVIRHFGPRRTDAA